jgi:hypothetical protein
MVGYHQKAAPQAHQHQHRQFRRAPASPRHRTGHRRENPANAQVLRSLQKRRRPSRHQRPGPQASRQNAQIPDRRQIVRLRKASNQTRVARVNAAKRTSANLILECGGLACREQTEGPPLSRCDQRYQRLHKAAGAAYSRWWVSRGEAMPSGTWSAIVIPYPSSATTFFGWFVSTRISRNPRSIRICAPMPLSC